MPIYTAMTATSRSLADLHKRAHLCKLAVVNNPDNPDPANVVDYKLVLPMFKNADDVADDDGNLQYANKETMLKKEGVIHIGTEADDMHIYRELDPGDEDAKRKYDFLMSNLSICAALCDGHWSDPKFNPTQIAHAVADNATLLAILKDESLPYDIRSVTARLLMEMFLETPGAL